MRIAIDLSRAGLAGVQMSGLNPCVRLAQAMVGAGTEHRFFLILSDEDPASVTALRSMMAGTLPAWGCAAGTARRGQRATGAVISSMMFGPVPPPPCSNRACWPTWLSGWC